jgi:hypothetical protein
VELRSRLCEAASIVALLTTVASYILLCHESALPQEWGGVEASRALDWTESWPGALVYAIEQNIDDGTEVGGIWYPQGYTGSLNFLGKSADQPFTVGLRFRVPDLEQGQVVKYARLRLAAQGGHLTSGAHLVIRGADEDSPEPFSYLRRPSMLPKTDAVRDWIIGNVWKAPGATAALPYSSPDLREVVNEILSRPSWGRGIEGKTLILTIEGGDCPQAETNFLKFEDYSTDPETRYEAILEVYPTLADAFVGKPVLGRPTDTSVTINMINLLSIDVYARYGTGSGVYSDSTVPVLDQPAGEPVEIVIEGLEPDATYYYRVDYREAGDSVYLAGMEGRFHTQRSPASSYVFTIQADCHIWPMKCTGDTAGLNLYVRSIDNIGLDNPDFHFSLGDFAHVEYYHDRDVLTGQEAVERYLDQRAYLDRILHSVPFYLALGNHEGEQGWRVADPADSVAVWGARARKAVIPNPGPDGFYSGDGTVTECCGERQSYYAWQWGDALFIVLDPFWYTTTKPHCAGGGGSENPWDWTLGEDQYNWLYDTLHNSSATWKFVLTHHLVGGVLTRRGIFLTPYGRGGIEAAKYEVDNRGSYEWGGEDGWGSYVFGCKRPGWSHGPIHDMMVNEGVTILFHGHDHVFVHQVLDGVIYQTCPQPSDCSYGDGWYDDGHYRLGEKRNNSGHLRVTVTPGYVQVDYVRSVLPEDEPLLEDSSLVYNRQVCYSYSVGIAGTRQADACGERPCLVGNRPNPFSAQTLIGLRMPRRGEISLKIYDVKGSLAATVLEGPLAAGTQEIPWDVTSHDSRRYASGVYFSRLESAGTVQTRKMLLVR